MKLLKKQLKLNNFHEVESFEDFKKNFLFNEFLTTIHHISNYELILKLNDFFQNKLVFINSYSKSLCTSSGKKYFSKVFKYFFYFFRHKEINGKIKIFKI